MSNVGMEGLVKGRKPWRKYSRANGKQAVNTDFYNYLYGSIPAEWPVVAGDCVQWTDQHGEIHEGTVRGARNINGVPHVTVKLAGGKVKPAALDSVKKLNAENSIQELPIKLIRRDGSTQTRVMTDEDVVNEYADDMRDGQEFPPIEVFYDGTTYWLADGFHRVSAAEKVGIQTVMADVKTGTRRDALLAALGANQKRGLHRKNEDKRFAVKRMLDDPEWRTWSDRAIAEHLGVSKDLVRKERKKLLPTNNGYESQIDVNVRRGDSFYSMNISNIGHSLPSVPVDDDEPFTPLPERTKPALPDHAPDILKSAVDLGTVSHNHALEIMRVVVWFPEDDHHTIINLCMDTLEKVQILRRLFKSMDYDESNRTYEEILTTGGFHYGNDMELWCNFATALVEDIHRALKSVSEFHRIEEAKLKAQARAEKAQSLPTGVYNVIYADPPWQYDNNITSGGTASMHYDTMPLEDICALPRNMNLQVADNAVLFMWVTNPFLQDAFEVVKAWGFEYKTNMVWVKTDLVKPGSGFYVRGRHELLFICTRGNFTPLDKHISPPIGSVLEASLQEHSRKPDDVYSIIERLYPDCNYLEMFARRPREGWDVYGNEV